MGDVASRTCSTGRHLLFTSSSTSAQFHGGTTCCNVVQPLQAGRRLIAEESMRSLLKPGLLIHLQQNEAGLIADLVILAIFLVLLAVR
jgi:hypothetical protein